jgi:ketosteroid isomerase-like protein
VSQENVDIIQAAFRAFERGDMDGVLRLCDENIEIAQFARSSSSLR